MKKDKISIVINGRVLLNKMNGIPRYAWEITKRLDEMAGNKYNVFIVIPANEKLDYKFINAIVIKKGYKPYFLWDEMVACFFARSRNAIYVNFANKGCLYNNSIVVIHDIRELTNKSFRNIKSFYVYLKLWVGINLALKNARIIITVSEFSRNQILSYLKNDSEKVIIVAYPGCEHYFKIAPDKNIFRKFPFIRKQEYFLSLSSIAPHKNYSWVLENAKKNTSFQYLIIGDKNSKLWDSTVNSSDNVYYLGFLEDGEIKALLMNSKGLIFPSLYEGFGLPPLEALLCGVPAYVSNIEVMREVYGSSVNYIDPDKPDIPLINTRSDEQVKKIISRYSWDKSSSIILKAIEELGDKKQ